MFQVKHLQDGSAVGLAPERLCGAGPPFCMGPPLSPGLTFLCLHLRGIGDSGGGSPHTDGRPPGSSVRCVALSGSPRRARGRGRPGQWQSSLFTALVLMLLCFFQAFLIHQQPDTSPIEYPASPPSTRATLHHRDGHLSAGRGAVINNGWENTYLAAPPLLLPLTIT